MGAYIAAATYALLAQGMAYLLILKVLPGSTAFRAIALWAASAICLFFVQSPLAVLLIGLVIVAVLAPTERSSRVAFYMIAVAALPTYLEHVIPFPGINYLLTLTQIKVATLVLLLPIIFYPVPKNRVIRGFTVSDFTIVLYVAYAATIVAKNTGVTVGLRYFTDQSLILILPFVIISRAILDRKDLDRVVRAFIAVSLILACVALVSTAKQWDFYKLNAPLDIRLSDFRSGFLRIEATANTHSLGFHLVAALLLIEYLKVRFPFPTWYLMLCRGVLLAGLFFTDSRGSMLALFCGLAVYMTLMIKNSSLRAMVFATGLLAGLAFAIWLVTGDFSDLGAKDSISYRQQLLVTSIEHILEYPFFGNLDYARSGRFDHLVQGQGIIDITNMYLLVLVQFGAIGAVLLFATFVLPMFSLLRNSPEVSLDTNSEAYSQAADSSRLRAVVLGAGAGWLVLIMTTSHVGLTMHLGIVLAALARIATTSIKEANVVGRETLVAD